MKPLLNGLRRLGISLTALTLLAACATDREDSGASAVTDQQIETLVRAAYPYVAMYNVNNKFAMNQGGYNTVVADTRLKDHTMRDIARPNNDTFYASAMLDLRGDAMILELPAFDSDYASLMITGYDHYVNIPMSTRQGDFREPTRMLVYTARTEGYDGARVEGIDRYFEATGDFVSAVIRIMPHASEAARMNRIIEQANSIRIESLSMHREGHARPAATADFPSVGETDLDVFEDNLLEVMQFVFNHTTFDDDDPNDRAVLEAFEPLGVSPGRAFDPERVTPIDGQRLREAAAGVREDWLSRLTDPSNMEALRASIFQPKGMTDIEAVLAVSIIGPIGIPQEEALYPQVATADGQPLNALHDYVIRMTADELPPARAFWSLTLYDRDQGFFIPNDRRKYSVGQNGGMQLDEDGGIAIYVAAEQPEGVPPENWLPIERKDLALSLQLRLYVPDLEAYESWTPPVAERIPGT